MPGRSTDLTIHPRGDAGAAVGIQPVPPAQRCGVVVGAGVDDPAMPIGVFRQIGVVGCAVERELQHFHARQPEGIAELFHIRCDHAEILGNQGKGATGIPAQLAQQGVTRRGLPLTVLCGAVSSGDSPEGRKGPEVIQAQQIHHLPLARNSLPPPAEARDPMLSPAVHR